MDNEPPEVSLAELTVDELTDRLDTLYADYLKAEACMGSEQALAIYGEWSKLWDIRAAKLGAVKPVETTE